LCALKYGMFDQSTFDRSTFDRSTFDQSTFDQSTLVGRLLAVVGCTREVEVTHMVVATKPFENKRRKKKVKTSSFNRLLVNLAALKGVPLVLKMKTDF